MTRRSMRHNRWVDRYAKLYLKFRKEKRYELCEATMNHAFTRLTRRGFTKFLASICLVNLLDDNVEQSIAV